MRNKIFSVLSLVFLFIAVPQLSQAQTLLQFGPYDLHPMQFGVGYEPVYYLLWFDLLPDNPINVAYLYVASTSWTMQFTAQVKIPNTYKITKVYLNCKDWGTSNVRVQLFKRNMFNQRLYELVDLLTNDSSELWRGFTGYCSQRVNNAGYQYFLVVTVPPSTAAADQYLVGGVRIEYTN